VRWGLTVPAGWSQASKQAILDAAVDARLVSSASAAIERVLLLYEPEAAALAVSASRGRPSPGAAEGSTCVQLKTGDTVLILDAGGECVAV
jgi:molecular chaperone DnaK (HSP70)